MSFLTGLEDYLYRKDLDFMFIGKNISDEYKQHIAEQFDKDAKYRVLLVDYGEDLSSISFDSRDTFAVFGELIWNLDIFQVAEATVMKLKNIFYLVGRHTLDEYILMQLYREEH